MRVRYGWSARRGGGSVSGSVVAGSVGEALDHAYRRALDFFGPDQACRERRAGESVALEASLYDGSDAGFQRRELRWVR